MSTEPTDRASQPGRFIARCATEADGGTPGMTFFTDGSQNVTDHCLSRYYIGVQPDPGALYVADEDAGTYAPSRGTESVTEETTTRWTPAQPRTDAGALDPALEGLDGRDPLDGDPRDDDEADVDGTDPADPETSTPATPTNGTTPTTAPPATPGVPGAPSPEGTAPTAPGQSDPAAPGSSEAPTTVPTVTEAPAPQQSPPPTSVGSTGPFGSAGQGSAGSHRLPPLPWPLAPRPAGSAS